MINIKVQEILMTFRLFHGKAEMRYSGEELVNTDTKN